VTKMYERLVVAPGLLNTSLHSLLVLSPILFEELRCHRVGRRVGIRVTQLQQKSFISHYKEKEAMIMSISRHNFS
jgi:hypothetical protein